MPVVGSDRICRVEFRINGALVDPATVTVMWRLPDFTEVDGSASVIHVSLGVYTVLIPLPQAGKYEVYWVGTGAQTITATERFEVESTTVDITPPTSQVTLAGLCSPWVEWDEFVDYCGVDPNEVSPLQIQFALDQATEWLYLKSAMQFPGECIETSRPYGQDCSGFYPWVTGYGWYGWAWGTTGAWLWGCGCDTLQALDLGYWPLTAVTEVKVDGVVLTPNADYRVDEQRWLVRLPDSQGLPRYWPCCQRMDLPDTMQDTWSVTVAFGRVPTPMGRHAAMELGKTFLGACGTGACSIPIQTTSISRLGMNMQLVDFRSLPEGRIGLPPVDAFLDAYNPYRVSRPTMVWSPDLPRLTRRVG